MAELEQTLANFLSRDISMVLSAVWAIHRWQMGPERLRFFTPNLEAIRKSTGTLDLGGIFLPNEMHLGNALAIIKQVDIHKGRPCHKLGRVSEFDDPHDLEREGYMKIISEVHVREDMADDVRVQCLRCGATRNAYGWFSPRNYVSWRWS